MKNNQDSTKHKIKTTRMISNNLFMLKYIFKYTPDLVLYNAVLKIITAFAGILSYIYVAKAVLDAVQKEKTMQDVLLFILAAVAVNVLMILLQSVYDGSFFAQKKEVLYQKMHSELFLKARNMELACYDNPRFYTDFVWAMGEANEKALAVLESLGELVYHLTSIAGIVAIIASVDAWGIVVAVVIVVISFAGNVARNKLEYELSAKQTPIQRRRDYTSRVLYQPEYAKEVRLNPVKGRLIENFRSSNKNLIDTIWSYSKRMVKWDIIVSVISDTLLINIVYTGYLLYQTIMKHAFTYGAFYALYSGTYHLKSSLQGLITNVTVFQKHSLYIERFRSFLEYEPKMPEPEQPKEMPGTPKPLCLKNVSFTYESLQKPTLKNINLTIAPGEKIALVGYNGAGKSTLIKLLMRLYDTTEGEITLGGTNIREYSTSEYRKYFGAVFQDYQIFAATIGENVKMDTVQNEDEPIITEALCLSGFEEKLNTLKNGTRTSLTREFDKEGVNLSGGEAQKVAIARIFPRECNMVILDEPSSALDPVSEYNVNQSMLEAAKDKTVIFISHRLSTTKNADRIIMLADGEIIEEGSHEELMALHGRYAEMFDMQAEKYRQEQAG